MSKIYTPVNPNAKPCVKNVLKYLADISGKKVITGQHTQNIAMEEYQHIVEVTRKEPALLGFELLSYSPNINYFDTDKECMDEVMDNYGSLKSAWAWAEKGGLITFTWHWFSPLYGRSKSFFSANTDYDADLAATEGTPEYEALIKDMDYMAGLLRPFNEKDIPILWRPFHEAEGEWFWWGKKGPEAFKKLFRIMYDRFTNVHHLDNLIWVLNTPKPETYPGDDVVDIISRDLYPEKNHHVSHADRYEELMRITKLDKIALLGEIGTAPDVDAIHDEGVQWVSYMTWSHEFCLSDEYTSADFLRKIYNSPYSVTKEDLPKLY